MNISVSAITTDLRSGSWTILARVSEVQELCYVRNRTLALFKFIVSDDTGDIHVVVFGDRAVTLSKVIATGQHYVIGSTTIKKADPAYNDAGHPCELHITNASNVKLNLAIRNLQQQQQRHPAPAAAAAAAAAVVVREDEVDSDDAAYEALYGAVVGQADGDIDARVRCECGITDVCSCFDADFDAPCQSEVGSVVYVLMLEGGKYYVGKTKNIEARVLAHKSGEGAAWTKRHHPIRRIRRVTREEGSPHSIELAETIHLMRQVGIENVRGSQFSEVVLTDQKLYCANLMIRDAFDLCNKCGGEGHMVGQCDA